MNAGEVYTPFSPGPSYEEALLNVLQVHVHRDLMENAERILCASCAMITLRLLLGYE